jgi:hypothetical protein
MLSSRPHPLSQTHTGYLYKPTRNSAGKWRASGEDTNSFEGCGLLAACTARRPTLPSVISPSHPQIHPPTAPRPPTHPPINTAAHSSLQCFKHNLTHYPPTHPPTHPQPSNAWHPCHHNRNTHMPTHHCCWSYAIRPSSTYPPPPPACCGSGICSAPPPHPPPSTPSSNPL